MSEPGNGNQPILCTIHGVYIVVMSVMKPFDFSVTLKKKQKLCACHNTILIL